MKPMLLEGESDDRCKLVCCSLHDLVAVISSKSHTAYAVAWFTAHPHSFIAQLLL